MYCCPQIMPPNTSECPSKWRRILTPASRKPTGMLQAARDAGLFRESLYAALSGECSPGFDTILESLGCSAEVAR